MKLQNYADTTFMELSFGGWFWGKNPLDECIITESDVAHLCYLDFTWRLIVENNCGP